MEFTEMEKSVLRHLWTFRSIEVHFSGPREMTLSGIAAALNVRSTDVSFALRQLRATGHVKEALVHVESEQRRQKVYKLTELGEEVACRLVSARQR